MCARRVWTLLGGLAVLLFGGSSALAADFGIHFTYHGGSDWCTSYRPVRYVRYPVHRTYCAPPRAYYDDCATTVIYRDCTPTRVYRYYDYRPAHVERDYYTWRTGHDRVVVRRPAPPPRRPVYVAPRYGYRPRSVHHSYRIESHHRGHDSHRRHNYVRFRYRR